MLYYPVLLFYSFMCHPQVQLSLGDFVAARRSLKKALLLGSQQAVDRQSVKKVFKYGKIVFCRYLESNISIKYA